MLHVWNIDLHLPNKWPSLVGKYTIHGAYGIVNSFAWPTSVAEHVLMSVDAPEIKQRPPKGSRIQGIWSLFGSYQLLCLAQIPHILLTIPENPISSLGGSIQKFDCDHALTIGKTMGKTPKFLVELPFFFSGMSETGYEWMALWKDT